MPELKRTLLEDVFYPAHDPRKASPEYAKVHRHLIVVMDEPCWICGIRHSQVETITDPIVKRRWILETHHSELEWAAEKALETDPVMLAKLVADLNGQHPQEYLATIVSDPHERIHGSDAAALREFLDSEGNMLVLCLPGDSPVLLADGSERSLRSIRMGDIVVGHDLAQHRVIDTMDRFVDEEIVSLDGRRMTADHPVLTPRGWLPACGLSPGDLALHVGMSDPKMVGLRSEEFEVLDSVVRAVSVPVVDAFGGREFATEVFLHHKPVFHDGAPGLPVPVASAHVASRSDVFGEETGGAAARQCIETREAAGVRAEPLCGSFPRNRLAATFAGDLGGVDSIDAPASDGAAFTRASRVAVRDFKDDQKAASTDDASAFDASSFGASWRPIRKIERVAFRGRVYDITVSGSHSFVTDGLVVHNCASHHRGPLNGIHSVSYPAWKMQRLQRPGGFEFIKQPAPPTI